MKIYAHRGASGLFPENTLPAFRHALDLGAAGIETDIHCTRDGVPVLTHDPSLLRTTGRAEDVRALTWAGLQAIAPQVPRLTDLLDLVGRQQRHRRIGIGYPPERQLRNGRWAPVAGALGAAFASWLVHARHQSPGEPAKLSEIRRLRARF